MRTQGYPAVPTPSTFNQGLTPSEHLELAGIQLERQAAQLLSGTEASKLRVLGEIFDVLALKLDGIARLQP